MKKNIRRFWAVLLAICSLVTLCPEELFVNASEEYLFYDAMSSSQKDDWKGTITDGITRHFENGLQITCQAGSVTQQNSQYVDLFADYPDVRVSADLTMRSTDNSKTRMLGVWARYNGKTGNYYGFFLHYNASNGKFYATLLRKGDDGGNDQSRELTRYSASTLAALTGKSIGFDTTYTFSMECSGDMIYLYVDDKLLDVYRDTSEYALSSGSRAGFRAINTSASVSNFRVEEASQRTIESVKLSHMDGTFVDGTLKLYQGFEISPYDYTANISFSDGLVYGLALNADLIGAYDNITTGKRSVPINCLGETVDLEVEIVARPEYIQEFAAKVEACKAAKELALAEKEYVDGLKEMYNSLSGYEVGTIDEEVIKKYQEAVDALYRLEHPELAEYDTIYINDFNESFDDREWDSAAGDAKGSWRTFNSMIVDEQQRYGWSDAISYLENTSVYGEINSVEADIMLTGEDGDTYTSLLSCIGEYGYYYARVRYSPQAKAGRQFTMQLLKNAESDTTLASANMSDKGIDMALNTWYTMRFTNIDGKLTIYLNDTKIIEYDDSDSPTCMTIGTFGFRAFYGDMRFDSLRVMGTATAKYEPQIEPTYYTDDFEDETEGTDPSHWIEETDSDLWKVYKKGNRLVYGTKSKEYGYTWLHTFESDPQMEMDFMVENAGSDGRIEFLTRYTQEKYSYAGIGYDFSQSKWYIYTARGMDFEPQIVYAADTYKLSAGTWNTIKIEEDRIDIKVYVNGELVIEDTNAYMTGYGRVGLLSENANLYIDNFSYTMPHGGSVSDGVVEYLFDYDTFGTMSCMQIESLGGSTLIGVYNKYQYISNDMGMTWKKDTSGQYTDVVGRGSYQNVMRVSEGVYLMLYADDFSIYRSDDYMKTWKKIGQVTADVDGNTVGGCHLNSLTMLTLKDGTRRIFLPIHIQKNRYGYYTRIFYSDDCGATWQESVNDTRDIVPNYVDGTSGTFMWGESKMTIDAEGVIRLYNSRQYGCIVYTESHDGGVTWEGFYTLPYLQNGTSSHSIAEDPENPGTFYMVCINDKTKLINDALPRTRLTLVRSTDGVNWEYVMDIERFTGYGNYQSPYLYQMIDPSISIIDGYMIITVGRSYAYEESSAHNKLAVRLVRLEMDKLPESGEWNDATIADPTRPETIEIDTMPQTIFGEGDTFAINGGTLKVTAFNGNVTYLDLNKLEMVSDEPNMDEQGTYEVSLMNRYGQMVSFEVEVTDNYNIEWNIEDKGEVAPYLEKIAKGLARTFTAEPKEGWRVKEVLVNGTAIEVKDNQFTVVGSEGIRIDVSFERDTSALAGYLYQQDFSGTMDDLIAEGWSENTATYFHIEDGMLVYNTVADDATGAMTSNSPKMQVVLGNAIAKTWTNYTLEADVLLTTTYVEGVEGTANVGIALGVNGTNSSGALTDYIGFNISMKSNYVTTGSIVRTGVNAAGDVSTNVQTTLANYAGKSDLDHIKIVVNGDLVTVYMNDEELLSYENEDVSKLSSGSIGLYAGRRQAKFDNIKVYPNEGVTENDYYEVGFYRSGRETMLHPFKAGYVFGGWYKDERCTEALDATTMTGLGYAKWVDEDVLSVKAQLRNDTTTGSLTTAIRFVTTVDSLDYQNAGMKINGGGKEIDYKTTSVCKEIVAREDGIPFTYKPTHFSEYSNYFATVTVYNIPVQSNLYKPITVTPYWTTTDGTYVTGVIRSDITIQAGIDANTNSQNGSTAFNGP